MAKRRRRSTRRPTASIVRVAQPRAASPIIRVQAPRALPARRYRRRSGRRSHVSGVVGRIGVNQGFQLAVGGAAYGFLVKQPFFSKVPSLPVIGKTGTAALILSYASSRGMGGALVRNAAVAACCIAGYQLGHDGKISGDELSGIGDETAGYDE